MGKVQLPADGDHAAMDDLVFELLSASLRRTVLRHLARCPLPVTVEELAAVVAASEAEETRHRVGERRRTAIRLLLVHVHLPKLVESGLVEYTPDGDGVVLSALGRDLASSRPRAWNAFDISISGTLPPSRREESP